MSKDAAEQLQDFRHWGGFKDAAATANPADPGSLGA